MNFVHNQIKSKVNADSNNENNAENQVGKANSQWTRSVPPHYTCTCSTFDTYI